jgi:hypothetical protein
MGFRLFEQMTKTKGFKKSKKPISRPNWRFHKEQKKRIELGPKVTFEIKNYITLVCTMYGKSRIDHSPYLISFVANVASQATTL